MFCFCFLLVIQFYCFLYLLLLPVLWQSIFYACYACLDASTCLPVKMELLLELLSSFSRELNMTSIGFSRKFCVDNCC